MFVRWTWSDVGTLVQLLLQIGKRCCGCDEGDHGLPKQCKRLVADAGWRVREVALRAAQQRTWRGESGAQALVEC